MFFKFGPWLIVLPVLPALKNYFSYSREFKIVAWYLILSGCSQTVSFILWKQSINNLPVLHVYTLLEFLILYRFYLKLLQSFIPGVFFYSTLIIFILFSFIDSFILENIFVFNTYTRSLEAFIFILFSVLWFVQLMTDDHKAGLQTKALSFINGGFFIYFSGSIVLFSLSNYINNLTHSLLMNIWTIHTILLVVLYLMIFTGLCQIKTK